ncbi:hypothetical protein [Paenibacillus chibensis]|nr:hypothetical protein [Paenibacillus chibensis]
MLNTAKKKKPDIPASFFVGRERSVAFAFFADQGGSSIQDNDH